MHKTIALALAATALPAVALAQYQPRVPDNWRPGSNGGHHDLPTPHPRPLPVTYYLTCTLGTSALARGDVWHVRNDGRNTVPAGSHIGVRYGYALADDYTLGRAMGPGDGQDFVSVHRRGAGSATDACEAHVYG